MRERTTIGFYIKQINNGYEKEFNNRLRTLGITSSQCEVLDYLFTSRKEEVTQRTLRGKYSRTDTCHKVKLKLPH